VAVAPTYSAVAIIKGIEGDVVVLATIDGAGKVKVVSSESGPVLLRKTAEAAAKRWTFSKTDVQEPRLVRITFAFRVIPKQSDDYRTVEFMPPYLVKVSKKIPEFK
jgi:TonB family protein